MESAGQSQAALEKRQKERRDLESAAKSERQSASKSREQFERREAELSKEKAGLEKQRAALAEKEKEIQSARTAWQNKMADLKETQADFYRLPDFRRSSDSVTVMSEFRPLFSQDEKPRRL